MDKKKVMLPILLLVLIVSSALGGYFVATMFHSTRDTYDTYDEVAEILNQYHHQKPSLEDLYNGAVEGMAESLDDKYTYITKAETKTGNLGISYAKGENEYYIGNVFSDSPCYKKLYKGDMVIKVNDTEIKNLNDSEFLALFDLNAGEKINITVKRGSSILNYEFIMEELNPVTSKKLNDETGYIKLKDFSNGVAAKFQTKLNEVENGISKLIIDLRDNGGGSLTELQTIANMFVTYKETPYMTLDNFDGTKYTCKPNINMVNKKPYDIIVLVNESTASAAEAFASIMSEYMGYKVIGKTTYGKGVYQSSFELQTKPGYYLNCTIGYWYTPNGNNINGIGVKPDIIVDYEGVGFVDDYNASYDTVGAATKNVQIMLKNEGYDGRVDGYFDNSLKEYLENNYEVSEINAVIYFKIYDKYLDSFEQNDIFINTALEL